MGSSEHQTAKDARTRVAAEERIRKIVHRAKQEGTLGPSSLWHEHEPTPENWRRRSVLLAESITDSVDLEDDDVAALMAEAP
jgi:hypothetical protein